MATENSMRVINALYHQTVSNTALTLAAFGFSAAQLQAADVMIVYVHSGNIRRRLDSTNPTTTTGIPTFSGGKEYFRGNDILQAWRMIRDGAVDAVVSIELFGWR